MQNLAKVLSLMRSVYGELATTSTQSAEHHWGFDLGNKGLNNINEKCEAQRGGVFMRQMNRWSLAVVLLLTVSASPAMAYWLDVFPSWVRFGMTHVEGPYPRDIVRVTNYSNTYLQRLSVRDTCFSDYRIRDNCHFGLYPNESCEIEVEFRPRRAGYRSCQIELHSFGRLLASIDVSGRATDE